jgi:hypothetical protein
VGGHRTDGEQVEIGARCPLSIAAVPKCWKTGQGTAVSQGSLTLLRLAHGGITSVHQNRRDHGRSRNGLETGPSLPTEWQERSVPEVGQDLVLLIPQMLGQCLRVNLNGFVRVPQEALLAQLVHVECDDLARGADVL